jgi:hypothetical protein
MKKTSGFMDKTIRYRRHHIRQSIRRFKKNVPSVYITHQLNVMTGNTTWLTSKLHQSIIKNIRNAGFPLLVNRIWQEN